MDAAELFTAQVSASMYIALRMETVKDLCKGRQCVWGGGSEEPPAYDIMKANSSQA